MVTGSVQTGRLRCSTPLAKNVVSDAASITPTVQNAARTCLREARMPAAMRV